MSNWLGIDAEYKLDLEAACGATPKDFFEMHKLADGADLSEAWSNCIGSEQANAHYQYQRDQSQYDSLVLTGTVAVAIVVFLILFRPLLRAIRALPRVLDNFIVNGSATAIRAKRDIAKQAKDYRADLKARIEEKVNRDT